MYQFSHDACPRCQAERHVQRHGKNPSGTYRCRCTACNKTFTPHPKPTTISDEKRQLIHQLLEERLSIEAIARVTHSAKLTIYNEVKKSASGDRAN